tara:strand:+ start:20 stop:1588 length:1569 start_codon:yes stop_codon:yes gene_type:complete
MLFLDLTERFFKQFHFILGVDPNLSAEYEKWPFPEQIPTKPSDKWQLIKDYDINLDFNVVAEIMKLKDARKKEDIKIEDALDLFEESRRKHWFVDNCELVEYHTIIKDDYCEFIGGFLKQKTKEKYPHLYYETIEEHFREWICEYSDIRTKHYEKLIRGIQDQPILDGTEKDPEPIVIKNINRKGTKEDEKLKEELIIKPDSKGFYEKADLERGRQKFKEHIEKENEILNTLGDSIKEASDRSSKMLLGISNNKPNTLHEMLLALHEAGRMCLEEWKDNVDTDTETQRHLRKQVLITKLNEIEKYKKLCIEGKQNLDSLGYRDLIRIEDELKQIKKDFLNSSKTGGITISDSGQYPYIPNTISTSKLPEKEPTPTEKESTKGFIDKNKFNNKSYEFIYDHFKEGLVDGDREYLSEDKLKEWIEEAFGNFDDKFDWKNREEEDYPDPIENRYLFTNTTNAVLIIKDVFYRFYQICGSPKGDAPKYSTLCGNYFEGETPKKVQGNWQRLQREQAKINERYPSNQ